MINKSYDTRLVFYISHIYDITFYLRLLDNIKHDKDQILLVINPKVEKQIGSKILSLNEISEYFTLPCNLNYDNGLLNNISSSIKLRRWINENININSILITTDKSQYLSILLISIFRKRILIQQVESIDDKYRLSLKNTLYFNLYHIVTGCKLMIYYEVIKSKGQLINLKFLKSVSDDVIYYTNSEKVQPNFTLPKIELNSESNKVIIFGSRYNSWKFVNQFEFKNKLFDCYRTIKKVYINKEFIYIPHPLETGSEYDEINELFDNKLQFEGNVISSEYYLYKNKNILITFSIGSTSSQSSFNMGIPSKVLYKCLNFDKNIEAAYDQLFLDFPESFFIKSNSRNNEYLDLSTSVLSYNDPGLNSFIKKLNSLKNFKI